MKLTIKGNIPSLKNSKQIYRNSKTGRPFITASDNAKAWMNSATVQLLSQMNELKPEPFNYPINITMVFYYKDKTRKDLDNSASGVLDALVKAKVIDDDDHKHVDNVFLQFSGYDKANPRVEIHLDD